MISEEEREEIKTAVKAFLDRHKAAYLTAVEKYDKEFTEWLQEYLLELDRHD